MKRNLLCLCLAFCVLLSLAACSAKKDSAASDDNLSYDMVDVNSSGEVGNEYGGYFSTSEAQEALDLPESNGTDGRKIIRSASVTMETTDFDGALTALEQRVTEFGGWIASSELQSSSRYDSARYAWYTLRIPSEKLEAFLFDAEEFGTVLSSSRGSNEITTEYYDTEARLKSLQVQEERLLAVLEKADTLDSIIQLENALSDVRYQIESLTGALRRYDDLVNMATVELSLREVTSTSPVSGTPKTLGERVSQQFSGSLRSLGSFFEGLVVFVIGNLPVILVWAVILGGGGYAGWRIYRKRKEKPNNE